MSTCSPLTPSLGIAPAAFAGALQFFAASQCLLPIQWPPSANVSDGDEFDFIVVGSGAAGAVVASRLSEVDHWKVLLIEAGGDPPVESIIPALHPTLVDSQYNWDTPIVNNTFSGQALKRFRISRGKVLGGSSTINFMMQIRGNRDDYDAWAAAGNKGWDWESVLPYFKKSEDIHDPLVLKQSYFNQYHGLESTGVKVTRAQNFDVQYERFLKAYNDIGFKILPEHNGPDQLGFSYTDFTIFNGVRESTAQRYLLPYKNRTNLYILKNAFVNKVDVDFKTKIATGVEVVLDKNTINVKAKREIVVSAGAIGSAEILLKSGVGPRKDLNQNKICTVANLPVGDNFKDHVFVPLIITGKSNAFNAAAMQYAYMQYLYNRTGAMSSGPVPLINGFFTVHDGQTYPDIQVGTFYFEANHPGLLSVCSDVFLFRDEVCKSIQELNSNNEILFIAVVLLHPRSIGSITLGENGELIVNPNYLHNEEDVLTLKRGVQKLTQLVNAESFQDSNPTVGKLNVRQCNDLEFDKDEYWTCYVRNMASSLLHPIGSCSMGRVVDSELKVYGVSKLRVADASVMPRTVSGNTNAPTVMIGEKVSDIIKNAHL